MAWGMDASARLITVALNIAAVGQVLVGGIGLRTGGAGPRGAAAHARHGRPGCRRPVLRGAFGPRRLIVRIRQ
ncbi:hypothetical protein ASF44_19190 [Pseudorhodoferax sp. Leaf274]|nr:hypothetical protein ASF44_19190 [Pseudorhodoferax sp. Leaf274]